MKIDKEGLLELLSLQNGWVYFEDIWYNIVFVGGEAYCNGHKMADDWTAGEEEDILDPIEDRFEVLDL